MNTSKNDNPRRDANAVGKAFGKHFGQISGLFELLEAGVPSESKQNVKNVRLMVMESLHQLRTSIEVQFNQGDC